MNVMDMPQTLTKSARSMSVSSSDSQLRVNKSDGSAPVSKTTTTMTRPRRNSDPPALRTKPIKKTTTQTTTKKTKITLDIKNKHVARPHPFLSSTGSIKKAPARAHPFLDANKTTKDVKKRTSTLAKSHSDPGTSKPKLAGSPKTTTKVLPGSPKPAKKIKGSPMAARELKKEKEKEEIVDTAATVTSMEWNRECTPHAYARVLASTKNNTSLPIGAQSPKTTIRRAITAKTTKEKPKLKKYHSAHLEQSSTSKSKSHDDNKKMTTSVSAGDVTLPSSRASLPTKSTKTISSRDSGSRLPPRSMPQIWVEADAKRSSRKGKPKKKKTISDNQSVVLRHELFRDSFALGANMGIMGVDIDREFSMSDTYKGKYTFKVKGPGMMGPYLEEEAPLSLDKETSRCFLHGGGTMLVGFKPGREYWVEVFPDPDSGSEIKEAILRTETEIARLNLKSRELIDLVNGGDQDVEPSTTSTTTTTTTSTTLTTITTLTARATFTDTNTSNDVYDDDNDDDDSDNDSGVDAHVNHRLSAAIELDESEEENDVV